MKRVKHKAMNKQFISLMALLAIMIGLFTSCSEDEEVYATYTWGVVHMESSGSSSASDKLSAEMKRFEEALEAEFGTTDNVIIATKGESQATMIARFKKVAEAFEPDTTLRFNGSFKYAFYLTDENGLTQLAETEEYTYKQLFGGGTYVHPDPSEDDGD